MTAVDELREAAQQMRENATAATRGPWVTYPTDIDQAGAWTVSRPYCDQGLPDDCERDCGAKVLSTGSEGCEEDNITDQDAHYIASMHPGVALAVADWLLETAEDWRLEVTPQCTEDAALVVARAYLGRQP